LVILLVALIVLGPDRLPKAAKQVGRAVAEFRRISSGFQDEVKRAIDFGDDKPPTSAEPPSEPPAPARPQPSAGPGTPDFELPPPPDDPRRN
jgi:Sec-independent protein translocase protein TatA